MIIREEMYIGLRKLNSRQPHLFYLPMGVVNICNTSSLLENNVNYCVLGQCESKNFKYPGQTCSRYLVLPQSTPVAFFSIFFSSFPSPPQTLGMFFAISQQNPCIISIAAYFSFHMVPNITVISPLPKKPTTINYSMSVLNKVASVSRTVYPADRR